MADIYHFICEQIKHFRNFYFHASIFSVNWHLMWCFIPLFIQYSVDVGPHIVYKHTHKIRVENPKLMELVRKNVATSDYVAIRGSIEYMKHDISGRAIIRARILAEAIEKMNGPGELKDIITGRYKFGRKFNQHYLVPEAADS